MLDAIKPLLDSGIITEETRDAISEAWDQRVTEAREQVRAELREEFSRRYQHDRQIMVEALEKMVTESLAEEIREFAEEKQQMAQDRVRFHNYMSESVAKVQDFMVSKLAEEIQELREDREQHLSALSQLEQFTTRALAEEIEEFETDKRAMVEARVRLISEGRAKMANLEKEFIAKASQAVREAVTKNLELELTQLHEDIHHARENMFGRRIFEAFATEFAGTYLNENQQIRDLQAQVESLAQDLTEAVEEIDRQRALVESKNREVSVVRESAERREIMADMLKPLNSEKAAIMRDLLESVQTDRLQSAYEKYLPAVLNSAPGTRPAAKQTSVLTEGRREVTGDKSAKAAPGVEDTDNVFEIRRLAGLN
jgi:hypothetical protein